MTPTMKLRWKEVYSEEDGRGPCASTTRYYRENGPDHFQLQQWWENEKGEGEWRPIEVES